MHLPQDPTLSIPLEALDLGAGSVSSALLLGQGSGLGSGLGPMGQFIPLLLIGAVFFFLVILPQRRQDKQRQARLEALKPGDEVVTRGGFLGRVHRIESPTVVELNFGERTRIRVLRSELNDLSEQVLKGGSASSPSSSSGPAKATPASSDGPT